MPGRTNYVLSYVLSDGNDTNEYNISTPSSSLSATAVAYPWIWHKYSTQMIPFIRNDITISIACQPGTTN